VALVPLWFYNHKISHSKLLYIKGGVSCVYLVPVCVPCWRQRSAPAAVPCSSGLNSTPAPEDTAQSQHDPAEQREPVHTDRSYQHDPPNTYNTQVQLLAKLH